MGPIDHEDMAQGDLNGMVHSALFTEAELNSNIQGAQCFSQLKPSELPDHLVSIVKDCSIILV